jgi:hypothetical protein
MSLPDFDWKGALRTVAPGLATALGGPLAGMAVAAVSTALLGRPDGAESEIVEAMRTGGTDALLKLREADNTFKVRMRELDINLEVVHQQDRDSARQREVKSGDRWTPRVLAGVIVGGFLAMVYMVLAGFVTALKDPSVATIVGTLIGYTSAKADQVVSYYFGSTSASAHKNDLLAKAPPINVK